MIEGHPQICLYQPEIPQNTGSIGRLAAATGCRLHLIKPLGFSIEDRNLLRPGLDYWPYLDLELHENFEDFLTTVPENKIVFFSKKAKKIYWDLTPEQNVFVFGRETSGLPDELWQRYPDRFFAFPIHHPHVRSLNLANSAAIAVYHQLAQNRILNEL